MPPTEETPLLVNSTSNGTDIEADLSESNNSSKNGGSIYFYGSIVTEEASGSSVPREEDASSSTKRNFSSSMRQLSKRFRDIVKQHVGTLHSRA